MFFREKCGGGGGGIALTTKREVITIWSSTATTECVVSDCMMDCSGMGLQSVWSRSRTTECVVSEWDYCMVDCSLLRRHTLQFCLPTCGSPHQEMGCLTCPGAGVYVWVGGVMKRSWQSENEPKNMTTPNGHTCKLWGTYVCVCVYVCVHVCVCACVRACVRACVCVCSVPVSDMVSSVNTMAVLV